MVMFKSAKKGSKELLNEEVSESFGATTANTADVDDNTWELNKVLDYIGTGPAQYLYWAGSLLIAYSDYAELSLIAIILPSLTCEFSLSNYFEALVTLSSFGSYAFFSVVFGKISDIFGRKKILMFSTTILLLFGVGSALAHNPWFFLFCRIVIGACVGINYSTVVSYSVESCKSEMRTIGPSFCGTGCYIAMFLSNLMAYFFLKKVGWRWFIIFVAIVPVFPALIIIILLPDSPRYLCISGKQDEAKKALSFFAKLNSRKLPEDISIFCHQDADLGSITEIVKSQKHLTQLITLSVVFFMNIVIEFGLIIFLPLGFSMGFCGKWSSVSTETAVHATATANATHKTCTVLSQSSLWKLSLSSFANIMGLACALIMAVYMGRLKPLRIISLFLTLMMIGFYICINDTVTFVFVSLLKFAEAVVNTLIWIMIPESFPTNIRNTAAGFINACGKIGGIVGTTSVYLLFHISPMSVVTLFLVASLVTIIGTFVLQRETKDAGLDES